MITAGLIFFAVSAGELARGAVAGAGSDLASVSSASTRQRALLSRNLAQADRSAATAETPRETHRQASRLSSKTSRRAEVREAELGWQTVEVRASIQYNRNDTGSPITRLICAARC